MSSALDWRRYRAFLVDVDGVIVRGEDPIPGAVPAVARLQAHGPVVFLSNNSTLSRAAYVRKLAGLGISTDAAHVVNSAHVTARYIRDREPVTRSCVLVIGERGLREELSAVGLEVVEGLDAHANAAWLATGMDRALNYAKLAQALNVLKRGARWVASNADATYPTPQGEIPGAGCVVGALRGMGFEPEAVVGKPARFCMELAQEAAGVEDPHKILVIGDRPETDIRGAAALGADSALVLSGVTPPKAGRDAKEPPTYVVDDLAALVGLNP